MHKCFVRFSFWQSSYLIFLFVTFSVGTVFSLLSHALYHEVAQFSASISALPHVPPGVEVQGIVLASPVNTWSAMSLPPVPKIFSPLAANSPKSVKIFWNSLFTKKYVFYLMSCSQQVLYHRRRAGPDRNITGLRQRILLLLHRHRSTHPAVHLAERIPARWTPNWLFCDVRWLACDKPTSSWWASFATFSSPFRNLVPLWFAQLRFLPNTVIVAGETRPVLIITFSTAAAPPKIPAIRLTSASTPPSWMPSAKVIILTITSKVPRPHPRHPCPPSAATRWRDSRPWYIFPFSLSLYLAVVSSVQLVFVHRQWRLCLPHASFQFERCSALYNDINILFSGSVHRFNCCKFVGPSSTYVN